MSNFETIFKTDKVLSQILSQVQNHNKKKISIKGYIIRKNILDSIKKVLSQNESHI